MRRILAALLLVGCLLFALIPAAAAKERSFGIWTTFKTAVK